MPRWSEAILARASAKRRAVSLQEINSRRLVLAQVTDQQLRAIAQRAVDLSETIAVTAVAATRLVGLEMFDVQLWGAIELAQGKIAEMQTGEGKTLAAVPAARG